MIEIPFPVIDVPETGKHITQLLHGKGYPAKEVARFMGFPSPRAVYKWGKGECLPDVDHLYALSRLLEVHMEEILVEQ